MTKIQRAGSLLSGILMILLSIFIALFPEIGFHLVGMVMSITMLVMGIRALRYYFTMARYMVDGRYSLYRGVIMLNLCLFTMSLTTVPAIYIIAYLVGIHAFAGGVDILGVIDARSMESPSWRIRLLTGLGNITIAGLCLYFGIFRGSVDSVVYVYSAGLFYSGVLRIIDAFRRSAVVYIQ